MPTGDPEAIADKVRELSQDPELALKMSENSKEKLRTELSSQRTVEKFIEYFFLKFFRPIIQFGQIF